MRNRSWEIYTRDMQIPIFMEYSQLPTLFEDDFYFVPNLNWLLIKLLCTKFKYVFADPNQLSQPNLAGFGLQVQPANST